MEAGTSFGVSTLFLAAAVRDTLRQETQGLDGPGPSGVVIGVDEATGKATSIERVQVKVD